MKKVLLIIGTLVVIGIGWFGYVMYNGFKYGFEQYEIAGETVGLAGFSSSVEAGAPNTATAQFAERLMPFTFENFPFDAACPVVAADFDTADILTIVVSGEGGQSMQVYDVVDGVCTARES